MTPAYISVELRQQVRSDAGRRCGYCHSSESLTSAPLEIEHIVPEAAGGPTIRENLWLACHRCNEYKGARTRVVDPLTGAEVAFFNPRTQVWTDHFKWSADGTHIIGLTPFGRATVEGLKMNNTYAVEARRYWVETGWHPPAE